MPGMADSLNVMGQEDAASNIMTINGPQGPMQIDISGMMPEDAEMIMAVARDAEEAGDPETQAQMMQLLQQLMEKSQQFEMLNDMSSPRDSRGGPNMMTPTGNVSQRRREYDDGNQVYIHPDTSSTNPNMTPALKKIIRQGHQDIDSLYGK